MFLSPCLHAARKAELGISSFGVSVTTMEEVFMKVGEGTEETLESRWVGWWVWVCGDYADVVAVCGWDYVWCYVKWGGGGRMEWEGGSVN